MVLLLDMSGNASASAPLSPVTTQGYESPSGLPPWQGPPGWNSAGVSCLGMSQLPPYGSLTQTTSAGPDQSSVLPGQKITVTLKWRPSEFVWSAPSKLVDCVWIGPHLSTTLSQVKGPGPTTGTYTFTYVVPAAGTGGNQICNRGVAWGRNASGGDWGDGRGASSGDDRGGTSGQNDVGRESAHGQSGSWGHPDSTETSAVLCYSILAAAAPEAPVALLFPLAGFVVGGGWLLLARRRRARIPLDR